MHGTFLSGIKLALEAQMTQRFLAGRLFQLLSYDRLEVTAVIGSVATNRGIIALVY
jgi:hypothetical protein